MIIKTEITIEGLFLIGLIDKNAPLTLEQSYALGILINGNFYITNVEFDTKANKLKFYSDKYKEDRYLNNSLLATLEEPLTKVVTNLEPVHIPRTTMSFLRVYHNKDYLNVVKLYENNLKNG